MENNFNLLDSVARSAAPLGEVFTADSILEGGTNVLAQKLGLGQRNNAMQDATFILSKVIILETAQNIFNTGSGIKNFNMDSFTLAKILKIVKRIEEKVNLILDTPLELSIKTLKSVINILEAGENNEALEYVKQMDNHAMQAVEYSKKGRLKEDFEFAVIATQLQVFAKIILFSFDKEKNQFLPFSILPTKKKELIGNELQNLAQDLQSLGTKIQPKVLNYFIPGGNKKEKGEIQDMIDSVLKETYSYISEGKGWTNMLQDVPEESIYLTVDPDLLPDGEEDAVEVPLGRKGGGEESEILRVRMWMKDGIVFIASDRSTQKYQHKQLGEIMFDLITTEGKYLISSEGFAAEEHGDVLGQYSLHRIRKGCSVYKQEHSLGGKEYYLYKKNNTLYVNDVLDKNTGYLRAVPSTEWQYRNGENYVSDHSLTVTEDSLSPCSNVTITAAEDAAVQEPDCLGTYQPTLQWSSGRKVFRNNKTGWILMVERETVTWSVRSSPESEDYELKSGCGTTCPASPKAAWSTRDNVRRWRYRSGYDWVEADITVQCSTHYPQHLDQPSCCKIC